MKCTPVSLPDGTRAILCGSRRYTVELCACGSPATKLCDWIIERTLPSLCGAIQPSTLTTCDAKLCDACATSPAPGKDLCPEHGARWADDPRNKQRNLPL